MSALAFAVTDAAPLPFAASPALKLRVRITESSGAPVHMIALRAQVQIQPQLRRYEPAERARLTDLFGTADRYASTLRPFHWMTVGTTVLGFRDETAIDLEIPCSYDFDVAAAKYLTALADGEIPLVLYFSGQVFREGPRGVEAEFVPWTAEAPYGLPLRIWRAAMDAHFPNAAWIRVDRETFAELDRFRLAHGLRSWDDAIAALCARAAATSEPA